MFRNRNKNKQSEQFKSDNTIETLFKKLKNKDIEEEIEEDVVEVEEEISKKDKNKKLDPQNIFKQKILLYSSVSVFCIVIVSIVGGVVISQKINNISKVKSNNTLISRNDKRTLQNNDEIQLLSKPEKDASYFSNALKYLNISTSSNKTIGESLIKSIVANTNTNKDTSSRMNFETNIGEEYGINKEETNKTDKQGSDEENITDTESNSDKKDAIYLNDNGNTVDSDGNIIEETTSSGDSTNTNEISDETNSTVNEKDGIINYATKLTKAAKTITSYGEDEELDITDSDYKILRLTLREHNINTDNVKIFSIDEDAFSDYVNDNYKLSDFVVIGAGTYAGQVIYLGSNNEGYNDNDTYYFNKDLYYNENGTNDTTKTK